MIRSCSFVAVALLAISGPLCARAQALPGATMVESDAARARYVSLLGNVRIGRNAAMLRAYEVIAMPGGAPIASGTTIIVSCDGKWVVADLNYKIESGDRLTAAMLDPGPVEPGTATARLHEVNEEFGAIQRRGKANCVNLGPEPRNQFLTVSATRIDPRGLGTAFSIVTGTAVRKGERIEVWIRGSEFRESVDDSSAAADRKTRELTGKYTMERDTYDCAKRSMGTSQRVRYDGSGGSSVERLPSGSALQLDPVVPNSVGETILSIVCTLY